MPPAAQWEAARGPGSDQRRAPCQRVTQLQAVHVVWHAGWRVRLAGAARLEWQGRLRA